MKLKNLFPVLVETCSFSCNKSARLFLSVVMIAMFAMPMEAWAQADGQAQPQGEQAGGKLTFVARPNDEAGELVFYDQTKRLTVTPKVGYYLDRVVFIYTERGGAVNETLIPMSDPGTQNLGPYYLIKREAGTVTAYFKPTINKVQVKFNMKGHGSPEPDVQEYELVEGVPVHAKEPDSAPSEYGYEFLGWFKSVKDEEPYDFNTELDKTLPYDTKNDCYSLTLYAKWNPKLVNVHFYMKDHGQAIADQTCLLGETAQRPIDPTDKRKIYVFAGWYSDSKLTKPYDFSTVLDNTLDYDSNHGYYKLTLYAKWLKESDFSGNCGVVNKRQGLDGSQVTWAVSKSEGSEDYDLLTISGTGEMNDGQPWKSIRAQIKKVIISDGVTNISNNAFTDCISLESVTIPSSVTYIGNKAFYKCSSLTSVSLPSNVTSIGSYAFYKCSSLTFVSLPSNVTFIGGNAFQNCSSLTSINIPSGVTSIGNGAFQGCSSLTSIDIPSGVTSFGNSAFQGCSSLTSIDIPSGVTSINKYTFKNCSSLTSINIPSGVTSIGKSAFQGCSSLTSINIPSNITSIEENTFRNCSSLTSITIPKSVTEIDDMSFYNCGSLTSIVVENGNTIYDSRDNCNAIILTEKNQIVKGCQNTVIPNSVTSIGSNAFHSCTGLTSIIIPNSVTSISASAFEGCSGLSSIVVESGNATYDSRDNCNAVIETATNTLVLGCKNTVIPNTVTSIDYGAFDGCTSLTSITIPNTVTSINKCAFYECAGLTSMSIPANVAVIGWAAFYGCKALSAVYIYATAVPTIEEGVFGNNADGRKIYVLSSLVDSYKKAENWIEYADAIEAIPDVIPPIITEQPRSMALKEGYSDGQVLTVAALDIEGQTLSYQWCRNTTNANIGGTAIEGATAASYTIPTGKASGTEEYYYCVVTATKTDNGTTASTVSDVAMFCVIRPNVNLVASPEEGGTIVVDPEAATHLLVRPAPAFVVDKVVLTYEEGGSVVSQVLDAIAEAGKEPYYYVNREDGTVTAYFKAKTTDVLVTFDMNGHGSQVASQNKILGQTAEEPAAPTADGYEFVGWYMDNTANNPYDFGTALGTDLTYDSENNCYTLKLFARWQAFSGVCGEVDEDAGLDGSAMTWALTGSAAEGYELTIGGSGDMADFTTGGAPWGYFRNGIKSVAIGEGVTSIGARAFEGCSSLPTITIPAGVTSIGGDAFLGCTGMADVYCLASADGLEWNDEGCNDFMPGKKTICHVDDRAAFEEKWARGEEATDVNVTFVSPEPSGGTYTVTVTASIAEGGTVTGGGSYDFDELITLTATPNEGYVFVSWALGDNENYYDDPVMQIYVEGDYTFVARFKRVYPLSGDYVAFYPENGYNRITEAAEGETVVVSHNPYDADDHVIIPLGKYFTGNYTSADVTLTPVEGMTDATFTMPGKAVTVSAELAEQEEFELDLTTTEPQEISESMWILFYSLDEERPDDYGYNVFDKTGARYLDLNLDGIGDVLLEEDYDETAGTSTYYAVRLTEADELNASYRFNLSYVEPQKYNSVMFRLVAPVPGDIDGDGVVNAVDLVKAIAAGKTQAEIDEIVSIIMQKKQ